MSNIDNTRQSGYSARTNTDSSPHLPRRNKQTGPRTVPLFFSIYFVDEETSPRTVGSYHEVVSSRVDSHDMEHIHIDKARRKSSMSVIQAWVDNGTDEIHLTPDDVTDCINRATDIICGPGIWKCQREQRSHSFTVPLISGTVLYDAARTAQHLTDNMDNSSRPVNFEDTIISQGTVHEFRYAVDITVEKLDQNLLSEITKRDYLSKRVKELYPGYQISNDEAAGKFKQGVLAVRGWLSRGETKRSEDARSTQPAA